MAMNPLKSGLWALAAVALLATGCKKEETPEDCTIEALGPGAWVCNEGGFGNNNASLSFLGEDGTVQHGVFASANGQPLGDVAQSIHISDRLGFLAINGSQKLEVFDVASGKRVNALTGFDYPRYFAEGSDGAVYVSNGSLTGEVSAIDGTSGQILWTASVGYGPERMAANNTYLGVCNSGGWGLDSTLSIVNLNTHLTDMNVHVGHRPVAVEVDGDGDFWVLCKGETFYNDYWEVEGHTPARLVEVSGSDFSILHNHVLGVDGDHPTHMVQSTDGTFYVVMNDIYTIQPTTGTLTLFAAGSFYNLDVHPETGNIWAAPYPDFQNDGELQEFNAAGELVNTHETGIAPNGVAFVTE